MAKNSYKGSYVPRAVYAPQADDDDRGGGGLFGLGFGPNINLGLGTALQEIGQGVTGLIGGVGSLLTPGKDGPGAGEFGSRLAKGIGSSVVGTVETAVPGDFLSDATAALLGDEYRPQDFFEKASDRGILPALIEDVGNVALVGGLATAPVKGAALASKAVGATDDAARLSALHASLKADPLISALQHPYRTGASKFRETAMKPALAQKLANVGIDDAPVTAADDLDLADAGLETPETLPAGGTDTLTETSVSTATAPEGRRIPEPLVGPLARAEELLQGREAVRASRDQLRLAEMERRIAGRDPFVQSAVTAAREHLLDVAAESGLQLARKDASEMVGEAIYNRVTGVKAAVDEAAERGVGSDVLSEAGLVRTPIPEDLLTPELEAALDEAAEAQVRMQSKIRETLTASRKGTEGLDDPLAADDAVDPSLTKKQRSAIKGAEEKRARADGLDGQVARERSVAEKQAVETTNRLYRIDEEIGNIDGRIAGAHKAFDKSRTKGAPSQLADEAVSRGVAVARRSAKDTGPASSRRAGTFYAIGDEADYAGDLTQGYARPKKPLAVESGRRTWGDGLPTSAGEEAARRLLTPETLSRITDGDMADAIQWVEQEYGVDLSQMSRGGDVRQKLLEVAGAQAARKQGFDAIIMDDPHWPELVALADNVVVPRKSRAKEAVAKPLLGKGATDTDFYRSGRRGAKAISEAERQFRRKRQLERTRVQVQQDLDDITEILETGKTKAQLTQEKLRGDADRVEQRVKKQLGTPSIERTPTRWQPLYQAFQELGKAAEAHPELADVLTDMPKTLGDIQALAAQKGFDPSHVRQFTPAQVRRLVFGNLRLGLGREITETSAGTRKARSGALTRAQAVDRSVESFMAAAVEATLEARTNAVIDMVEKQVARKIPEGGEIPAGWTQWDPTRTFLLTGTEVSEATGRAIQTAPAEGMVVPESVVKMLRREASDHDHWLYTSMSKITSPWRALVLTLSPAWYARNIVGNVLMAQTEGVSLKDWQAALGSLKTKDRVGSFADIPWVTTDTLAQEAGSLADDSLVPMKGFADAVAEGGRVRGAASYAQKRLLRVNQVVDEFARAAVYHQGRRLNMAPEEAWKRASEALVDYGNLSPFERKAVRAVTPFYSWQKGILKVTLNQGLDHPARAGILQQLGQMQEDYVADMLGVEPEDVPDYYKHLAFGEKNIRSWNPFADPTDILSPEGITRSMNPFVELFVRKGLGAPEFFPDSYRLGAFGQAEADVDVPTEFGDLLQSSPAGRATGGDAGAVLQMGLQDQDLAKIRSRILRSREQIRGIPNPESVSP